MICGTPLALQGETARKAITRLKEGLEHAVAMGSASTCGGDRLAGVGRPVTKRGSRGFEARSGA